MKKAHILGFVLIAVFYLSGCATSSYSVGKDFAVENVEKIVKGKTTGADLVQMFGEPFNKTVISENEEKWIYTYTSGTTKAQSYVLTMQVNTESKQKTLDVLLKDGVVINFTFNENTNPYGVSTP